ncbi:MAG: hypothetical protein HZA36_01685 [Parcubacteria group bacterium]|nr:hypothetical protein [Parcubacteria group bacterium]
MVTKDDVLSDVGILVEGGLISLEEGERYKAMLEHELPQSVVEKILVALEQNQDVEGENMKVIATTIFEMRKNAEQSGDELLNAEADRLDRELKERMSRYELQVATLEKKYQEVIAPKTKELDIEEQRKKIAEM